MPLAWTLLLNVPLGLAAWWVARFGFGQPAGLPRGLAAATLAWTWATLGMEILGGSGFLTRGPLLGWVALGLAIGGWLRWRDRHIEVEEVAPTEPWQWEATLAVGLVVWASLILGVRSLVGPVKVVSDGPIYHLYFAARWWKAGRLFLVAAPFGESAATYFPAVGDLSFAWLMVGWGGDRLAKVGQAPYLLAAALAALGLARRLGAGVGAAAVAVAWFVGSTPLLLFNFEANVDSVLVAGYLLAAYFFLRYALGDGAAGTLALGGLAAGGALGTKPTGVVFVPVLLALAGRAALVREGSIGRKARALLLLAATPMVMAGYWYGRNALLTGNPLYPLQVRGLGRVVLPGWFGPDAMRLSPFYLPPNDLRALGDIVLAVLDPRQAPVWLAALAGAWAWGRSGPALKGWVAGFAALAVANVALYWLLIPYRTQQRFMFQALGMAVVPLARTFDRGRWLRATGVALLAVHLLTPQNWPFSPPRQEPPWDLTARAPNAVPGPILIPSGVRLLRAVATDPGALMPRLSDLGLGLGALAIARAWGRSGRGSRARAIGVSLGVVGLAIAAATPRGGDPRRSFYPDFADFERGWLRLDLHVGPAGARIAYAGTNLPYYLLGPGLRNEVRYVNVDAHRDWLMHDYHRAARARGRGDWPNPRVGWDRADPDYAAWLANLRAAGVQILVVARISTLEGSHNVADPLRFPIERRWAESHPEAFEPLDGVPEGDPQFRIYRARPSGLPPREPAFPPVQ
ncbi:MAG: 4-amino-4-deoxy-L-arabinose transferase [Planctomycetaceae bacterium]